MAVTKSLDTATLEVDAERQRCADCCERMALIFEQSAAMLREEGKFPVVTVHLTRPFFRKHVAVHQNWERAARHKEQAAHACRTVKQSILEGWELKPWAPTG